MSLYPVLRRSGFPSGLDFWRFGDVDRVFDRILGSVGRDNGSWFPAVDVKETSDEITFHAELPGLKAEDVKVQLEGDVLTISGEKRAQTESKGDYRIVERRYGKFVRSFTLPESADAEKIGAEYSDGVLTVTLAKLAKSKPRNVDVKVKAK